MVFTAAMEFEMGWSGMLFAPSFSIASDGWSTDWILFEKDDDYDDYRW